MEDFLRSIIVRFLGFSPARRRWILAGGILAGAILLSFFIPNRSQPLGGSGHQVRTSVPHGASTSGGSGSPEAIPPMSIDVVSHPTQKLSRGAE